MSELTAEEFNSLPEKVQSDYTQEGDVYIPAKDAKLKSTLDELDKKHKAQEQKFKELEEQNQSLTSQLSEVQKAKQEEAEREKAEGLEKAKSQKDVDSVIKQYEEKLEHLQKQQGESQKQFEERIGKMSDTIKREKRGSIVSDLAAELALDKGSKRFKQIVSQMIDVDPDTGDVTYLDEDGRATSLDQKGFVESLKKDESLWPLMKAEIATSGGGNSNGSGNGRTLPDSQNQAAADAKKKGDVAGFIKANLKG